MIPEKKRYYGDLSEESECVSLHFRDTNTPSLGVLRGDEISSVRGAGFEDVLSIIAGGAVAREKVDFWLQSVPWGDIVKANDVTLAGSVDAAAQDHLRRVSTTAITPRNRRWKFPPCPRFSPNFRLP